MNDFGSEAFEFLENDVLNIDLIDMSKGSIKEFFPTIRTSFSNIDEIADSSLRSIIETKKNENYESITVRKRKIYRQYLDRKLSEKIISSTSDDIMTFIVNNTKISYVPITLRKRLLYQKIVNS